MGALVLASSVLLTLVAYRLTGGAEEAVSALNTAPAAPSHAQGSKA
jgi:hypothetical protein